MTILFLAIRFGISLDEKDGQMTCKSEGTYIGEFFLNDVTHKIYDKKVLSLTLINILPFYDSFKGQIYMQLSLRFQFLNKVFKPPFHPFPSLNKIVLELFLGFFFFFIRKH